jgi:multiple sugar transport system permease protein
MAVGGPVQVPPATLSVAARLRQRLRPALPYRREDVVMGYLFILVAMVIFLTFSFAGMIFDFWISFHHWDLLSPPQFRGLDEYSYLFRQDIWWHAIRNTVEYSLIVVPTQTVIAFILALIANQNIRGQKFFRTTFYFPSVTSSVAISLLFLYLMNNYGLVNYVLRQVGIQNPPNWLADTHTALPSIMGLNIWTTTGTLMIIFLAALQDVPRDMLEAAAIDGATGFQAVTRVVIPLVRPALFFVVANGLIATLQVFDQAFVLSQGNGGPENATMTAVLYLYNTAFKDGFYGVAAAGSFLLFAFIFVATITVRRLIGEEPR